MQQISLYSQDSMNSSFCSFEYHPPTLRAISGTLPDRRWLAHPVIVLVEYDDGEFVVSEPHFHMHASASTEAEAVEAFRRIFAGYLDVLEAEEETLSPRLREQLQYLRSCIRSAKL
jgi:predicted RNase H-like HicB family nuclease